NACLSLPAQSRGNRRRESCDDCRLIYCALILSTGFLSYFAHGSLNDAYWTPLSLRRIMRAKGGNWHQGAHNVEPSPYCESRGGHSRVGRYRFLACTPCRQGGNEVRGHQIRGRVEKDPYSRAVLRAAGARHRVCLLEPARQAF